MWQDLRDSFRALRRSPGFAAVAVLVLALGIAVNTAIFSVINAVLYRPPEVRAPNELQYIYALNERSTALSYRDYQFLRSSNDVFAEMVGVVRTDAKFGQRGDVEQVQGEAVSANYFDVLGITPMMGRAFNAQEDEQSGASQVAILSHDLWSRRFHSDPNILGKTIQLTYRSLGSSYQWPTYTIVGVTGPDFKGVLSPFSTAGFWVPLTQRVFDHTSDDPQRPPPSLERAWVELVIGRLKPGATRARARLVVTTLAVQLAGTEEHRRDKNYGLVTLDHRRVRLPFDLRGDIGVARVAAGLVAVACAVLLVAAANLAGLFMARGVSRRGEIGVRLALGVSRWRLVRQLVVESLVLSTCGAFVGVLLARSLVVFLIEQSPKQFGAFSAPFVFDAPLDVRVLLFTAAVAVLAGVVVSLGPARQAFKTDVLTAVSGHGAASPRQSRRRIRYWIVVPQVGGSLTLLLAAGVLTRPLLQVEMADPGYEPDQVVFVDFDLRPTFQRLPTDAERMEFLKQRSRFYQRLDEGARTAPAVTSSALVAGFPNGLLSMRGWIITRGDFPQGQHWWVSDATVSRDYFHVMGIKLTQGRAFDFGETPESPPVAVVSEAIARSLWPGQNAVGQYFAKHWPDSKYPPRWFEVIGVVKDIATPLSIGWNPYLYFALSQDKNPLALTVAARGNATGGELIRQLRQAIFDADPAAEIYRGSTMSATNAAIAYPRRMAAGILSLAGLIGLLLASIGIYGVVSYSVAERVREIGIRMALGARRWAILWLIILEGMWVTLIGSLVGLVLAALALNAASKVVTGVPLFDLASFLVVPLVLSAVILFACYIPARRAARVDPMVVLRGL